MTRKRTWIAVAGATLVVVAATGGVAVASNDDGDATVSGPGADRATQAALRATGGGTANSVERDGENGATWEVEVTRPDGTTVDVRLDEGFGVVVIEGDGESAEGAGQDG